MSRVSVAADCCRDSCNVGKCGCCGLVGGRVLQMLEVVASKGSNAAGVGILRVFEGLRLLVAMIVGS